VAGSLGEDDGALGSVWVELALVVNARPVPADVRNVESVRLALAGVGVVVAVAGSVSVSAAVKEERMLFTSEVTLSMMEAMVATVLANASIHLRVLDTRLEAIKKRGDVDVSAWRSKQDMQATSWFESRYFC
jgi:hypothetical protein